MILEQAQGDLLQQDRLAGPRRRHDQAALAHADGRDQIDDAHVDLFRRRFQDEPAIGMQRRQILEGGRRDAFFGTDAVDQIDLHQGEVVLAFDGQTDGPFDDQAGLEAEPANLAGRDVNVFRRGEIVVGDGTQEAVAVGQDFEGAGAAHGDAAFDLPADDAHDELAAIHAGVFADAFAFGIVEQLGHGQAIEIVETRGRLDAARGGELN